jgi:hypothetical protein
MLASNAESMSASMAPTYAFSASSIAATKLHVKYVGEVRQIICAIIKVKMITAMRMFVREGGVDPVDSPRNDSSISGDGHVLEESMWPVCVD